MCVYVRVGQRIICRNLFFPSIMWIPEIGARLSGLDCKHLPPLDHLSSPAPSFEIAKNILTNVLRITVFRNTEDDENDVFGI